ncbi:MAG: DUF5686 family protein [Tenacibaculum sp.]
MKNKIVYLLFAIPVLVSAQLKIKGIVVDEFNKPIPFVNIVLLNTANGTLTDEDGKFLLKSKKHRATLSASSLGFKSKTIKINKKTSFLRIVLKEVSNELDEVVLLAKPKKRLKKEKNPAYKILKKLWRRKRKLGLKSANYYQYKKHTALEIKLNNLDTVFLKKMFKQNYAENIKLVNFDNNGVNYYLPFFFKETISNIYANNISKQIREDIEAEREHGLATQGFAFDRMTKTFKNIDIFKNHIKLLQKFFASPLSSSGFASYDYVLYDSIKKNNKKLYNIYFFPRRDGDLAFQGNVLIVADNYSVKKIKMTVGKKANLNFVRGLTFEKEFKVINDSIYIPAKNTYEADFTFIDKNESNKGLSIKKTVLFSNYLLNKPKPDEFYLKSIKKIRPKQFEQGDLYWGKTEKIIDKNSYELLNIVKSQKKIKNLTELINTFSNGYINTNVNLQLGPFWTLFANNQVEGFRTKFGFRTFKTKDDRFKLTGHLAYGFKDNKMKYAFEGRYLLSYKPRIAIGLAHQKDIEQLGSTLLNTTKLLGNSFGTTTVFNRGDNFYLSKVKKFAVNFDCQIAQNFHLGSNFSHSVIKSASEKDFSMNYIHDDKKLKSKLIDVATDIYISYTPGRFVYGFGVERRFGKNVFPALVLNYRKGYKNLFSGTHNYDKVQINYQHPILIGSLGLFDISIEVGKTFGTVPISLLNPIPANQSLALEKNTFSLLNYYDFVTDTYLSTHLEHHFNGYIINRIPFLKKLNLRSLLIFRVAYGTISKQNKAISKSNINYNSPKKPYCEYGIGLENIGYGNLRFFRIDAIWRSDYTPPIGSTIQASPKFAIRIGVKPGL